MPKLRKGETLSNKQKVFVAEYLKCWNATEAALRAGYSARSAAVIGCENLEKPCVREIVDSELANKLSTASSEFERVVRGYVKGKYRSPSVYIYFILAGNGLTKIGIAKDIKSRMDTLNTASPIELTLLFYFEPQNAKRFEQALHNRFAHKRVRGEWFALSSRDISWIKKNYDILDGSR